MEGWNWTWKDVELASSTAERLAREFQAGVYEAALRRVEWRMSDSVERTRLSVYLDGTPNELPPSELSVVPPSHADGAAPADGSTPDQRRHHRVRAAHHPTPQDFGLLVKLGELYARLGWLEKCREVKLLLSRLYPDDPLYLYNLACSHSLLGEIDQAFDALARAIDLGYDNLPFLQADSDLDNLKNDRRFDRLVEELESSR